MRAINKVMKAELGANAIARWHEQLDEAIGETVFAKSVDADSTLALPAPKIWCPTRPTLTRLLAKALLERGNLSDGKPVAVTAPLVLGPDTGVLTKVISRRLVDFVIATYGEELRSCGEIRISLFEGGAEKQLAASIARHATDVLTYLSQRAKDLVDEGEQAVIEMQSVDQVLHGRETRGSGLVTCGRGKVLVEKAAQVVLASNEVEVGVEHSSTSSSSDEEAHCLLE